MKSISIKFEDKDINALARPEIIFIDTDTSINNCYYWLFIKLVFVLIDDMSYWNISKSNSNSRSIYIVDVWYIFL